MNYTTFAKLRNSYKTGNRFMTISYNVFVKTYSRMRDIAFDQQILLRIINRTRIPHKYNTLYGISNPKYYMYGINANESIRDNCDMYSDTLRDFIRS